MATTTPTIALTLAAAGLALIVSASAQAGILTGSGAHLPIPSSNPGQPAYQSRAISALVHPVSFTGSWTAPAQTPWIGSFTATGSVPGVSINSGATFYDFTTLTSGTLPANTFFVFGDVDRGSTLSENISLMAFDTFGNAITTAWLNEPVGVWGSGNGTSGEPITTDMPGWSLTGGAYKIDGATVTGSNPSVAFALTSNTAIAYLEVSKAATHFGFSLAAPVPAPASGVVGLALLPLIARRRRR